MNFHVKLVLWCVLVTAKQCLTGKECVQRRLGACKTTTGISLDEFHRPQPDGFLLKTSMEFNLMENKYSFENNLPVEKKRPVSYNLNNAALVKIFIYFGDSRMWISLGRKYYRLAELTYENVITDISEKKYSRYTPILPTFPYNLHLEITINGTFSVYADGNTEPFFEYQVPEPVDLDFITFETEGNNDDLIALMDCSAKYKPNCGSHRVETLYGCRWWVADDIGLLENIEGFQQTYGKDVFFDEFIVVDTAYSSDMRFIFEQHRLIFDFRTNRIHVELETKDRNRIKSVHTVQWFEVPQSPYAVRVLLTTGENNYFLNITNLRNNTIISMNLCEDMGSVSELWFRGSKLYFDCLTSDASERPTKAKKIYGLEHHENGYNYTKTFIDTSDFASKPFVMYQYEFGNSTNDWCPGEPQPEVLVTSKYDYDSLENIIERSNTAVLSELKEINTQNNAISDTNAAVVTQLTEISDSNKALLSELKKVSATADINAAVLAELKVISDSNKALLDAKTTQQKQNTTTVNNYYNQLNVTEFLKFLRQN